MERAAADPAPGPAPVPIRAGDVIEYRPESGIGIRTGTILLLTGPDSCELYCGARVRRVQVLRVLRHAAAFPSPGRLGRAVLHGRIVSDPPEGASHA